MARSAVVETEQVLSQRVSLGGRVGVVRLTLLLPCSVGNRRGEWRRKMVGERKVVQRKVVRRKRWPLWLPLQSRQVEAVASSRGPGGGTNPPFKLPNL